ncbi:hypothetical protein ACHAWU_000747 [Discostella pseudostelligera]|uniref:SET domain-containing protein n=1 Tax=Discostella pseudostelligera TaxID=259834 RepID=A0ABD3M6S4_9STRA
MAKRQRRSNVGAAGSVADRKSAKQHLPLSGHRRRRYVTCTVGILGLIPVLAILVNLFVAGHDDQRSQNLDDQRIDPRIPRIDSTEVKLNPERENEILDFLNNFVCNYRPNTSMKTGGIGQAADIEGYCHPRLSADPHLRTQRVSPLPTNANSWSRSSSTRDDGILAGELVMRLPRPLQIWDLDALRDKYIQHELLGLGEIGIKKKGARHKNTQNPLDSGAYLAVYLIRLLHGSRDSNAGQTCNQDDANCNVAGMWDDMSQHKERVQMLSAYIDILPTTNDRQSHSNQNPHSHPLFWSLKLVESLFPRYTYTYDLIIHYQQMIESEYAALTLVSKDFKRNVSFVEYLSMRINVLSRAFGVTASTSDNGVLWGIEADRNNVSLTDEMRLYETSNFGISLDNSDAGEGKEEFKFRSMCPLLDMYNSHPNPNVIWGYDSRTSSYLIHASKKSNIPPNHSIVVSYGKYTDGHLLAKYGYVNGDGTSPTEIILAVFHRMLGDVGLGRQFSQLPFDAWDPGSRETIFGGNNTGSELVMAKKALEIQAKELLRYLMFDDGYEDCIDLNGSPDPTEEELKLLKLQHLARIANNRDAWIVRVPSKFPHALPLQTDGSPIPEQKKDKKAVGLNAENIISTCRLLSLTVADIGGNAVNFLREGLIESGTWKSSKKWYFRVENKGDALEFRAMMCVVRLCNVALGRYANHDTPEPTIVGSTTWNAWYVVSGEVRALGSLLQAAASEANKIKERYQSLTGTSANSIAAITVREEGSCPLDYSLPLLDKLSSKS